jgi:predicted homoserine dehydrogenase-like protein
VPVASILSRLRSLAKPIRVGVVGTGHTGTALLYQCGVTPGIECAAVADIVVQKAIDACVMLERDYEVVADEGGLNDAIARGKVAICEDGSLLAQCESVDVLIESSSSVEYGGRFAVTALESGIHVVMMNAEADLIFGPHLMHLARKNGVVYTSCDGDQPGVLSRLLDDIQLWGFELVMAGNIKGFLDRYANPTTIVPEADKRFLDYKMCTAYTDGTKLCVEMALVANAFGLDTHVPGMHGPRTRTTLEVLDLFDLEAMYADGAGVVDYVLGAEPKGGVFAVGYCEHPLQKKMLDYFPSQLGNGPFYVFDRPYHLCHVEAMQCVAEAFLDGSTLLEPTCGFRTNVYCYAKQDLAQGDCLDGIGGYACYGLIENCTEDEQPPGLPVCLAEDLVLRRSIAKDERILLEDVAVDPQRFDFRLYSLAVEQSNLVAQ